MEHILENLESIKSFVLAGKAIFTVRNEETGNRFTFKVKAAKTRENLWWVSVLTRSDNSSDSSYTYLGTYSKQKGYSHSPKSYITPEATSAKVAAFYFRHLFILNDLEIKFPFIKTYHEGHCGRCGRRLTVPESIISGFGPECVHLVNKTELKKIHINPAGTGLSHPSLMKTVSAWNNL